MVAIAAALSILGAALAAGGVAAQEMMEEAPHPAHIHTGSCPDVGDVVAPLGDVSPEFLVDGTPSASDMMGQETGIHVQASVTNVPLGLGDILGAPHAIVVHKSAQEPQVYWLCGDIGGPQIGTADLPVGLGELNESHYSGVALLHDNGDGTTAVTLVIVPTAAAMMATPAG
jgi:hypothetical protein